MRGLFIGFKNYLLFDLRIHRTAVPGRLRRRRLHPAMVARKEEEGVCREAIAAPLTAEMVGPIAVGAAGLPGVEGDRHATDRVRDGVFRAVLRHAGA